MALPLTIAARLHLLHRCRCPLTFDGSATRSAIGRYAEYAAASWLRAQGATILRHNFRWGNSGELDLVYKEGDTLVFAEVKCVTSANYGSALRTVTHRKRKLLRIGARYWLSMLKHRPPHRFDVLLVRLIHQQYPFIERRCNVFPDQESSRRAPSLPYVYA